MNARLVALFLCFLPACSSSDPRALTDEGSKALNSGKYEEAAESYTKALAEIGSDTANVDWKRAQLGLIQARARLDGARAQTEFLELARANPGKVTDADFNLIASKLGDAGKLSEAIAVLEAGKTTFPNSQHLDALGKDLRARAKASGDSGALDKLKGLGYVGDE
jgi:tetratricopeptide (TPR) repeat protein